MWGWGAGSTPAGATYPRHMDVLRAVLLFGFHNGGAAAILLNLIILAVLAAFAVLLVGNAIVWPLAWIKTLVTRGKHPGAGPQ